MKPRYGQSGKSCEVWPPAAANGLSGCGTKSSFQIRPQQESDPGFRRDALFPDMLYVPCCLSVLGGRRYLRCPSMKEQNVCDVHQLRCYLDIRD